MKLLRDSEVLTYGRWIAAAKVDKEGNYTCEATNTAGFDSKNIQVTLLQGMTWVKLISNFSKTH